MKNRNTGPAPPKSAEKPALVPVYVQPGASRNRLGEKTPRGWKLAVTAPPIEGRANRACVEFLAKTLGISRSAVRLAQGKTSRQKLFTVEGLSLDEVEARLAAAGRAVNTK